MNAASAFTKAIRSVCMSVLGVALVATAAPDAVGGGYADCGIYGEYFANAELSGSPAFTRRDVRIDFDWGTLAQVGGSNTPSLRTFPRDNFSVRWTGALVPRFSEDYTIVVEADEGVRVAVKPRSSSTWTTVIDQWSGPAGTYASPAVALTAGVIHDIRVEYRELTGAAKCRVLWRSYSTPQEIIDPVAAQGLNASSWGGFIWADKMKSSRYGSDPGAAADTLDWPATDMTSSNTFVISEADSRERFYAGTCLLSFKGQARVNTGCCNTVTFKSGTQTYPSPLARGVGYDAATNTTTVRMTVNGSRLVALYFDQTSRTGGAADNSGITGISLMLPLVPDDTLSHETGAVVYQPFKKVVSDHYTCLRWLEGANGNTDSVWSDRTLPGYAFFSKSDPDVYWSAQENWEYLVMLANETGKDLYLTTPVGACDDYFVKLAQLVRYGSDGVNPYTSPQADPVYPPLNPNIRVYVEHANEIWNWAFVSTQLALQYANAERSANSALWQIINYDGQATNTTMAMRRWCVTRTVSLSNAFRAAFGDAAMGPRVRTVLEYQYNSEQASAYFSLTFLNAWYNNADGNHVAQPHPVSYYIWGAGGATYYGVGNSIGRQSRILVIDSSFERPVLSDNTLEQRPAGTAWTFTGTSGIYRSTAQNTTIGSLPAADTAPNGRQAAYIIDTGSISQSINFPDTGWYALNFNAAYDDPGWDPPFSIFVDTSSINPRSQSDIRVAYPGDNAGLGGWSRDIGNLSSEWGSAVFHITSPGPRTIRFKGTRTGGREIYLDNIRIASADSIMSSGFGSGQAWGQVASDNYMVQLNSQAIYSRAFGLELIAYEAGWSLGGDFTQRPIQNWCKLVDPRAERINDTAQAIWDRSGSFMNVWGVYTYWKDFDFAGAAACPIMKSFSGIANRPRAEATNGTPVPGTLRPRGLPSPLRFDVGQVKLDSIKTVNTRLSANGAWIAWLFITPERADYSFRVYARGSGGFIADVDGSVIGTVATAANGGSTPLTVSLVKGPHAVRVQSTGGDFTIDSIVVASTPLAVGSSVVMPSDRTAAFSTPASAWSVSTQPSPQPLYQTAAATIPVADAVGRELPGESNQPWVTLANAAPQEEGRVQRRAPAGVRRDNFQPTAFTRLAHHVPRDMRWTPGRSDISVVSVRASSWDRGNGAANVNDRDLRTRWSFSARAPQWLTYDLGGARSLSAVSILWYARRAAVSTVRVEVSPDGVLWQIADRFTIDGRGTHLLERSFVPQTAQFVRVVFDAPGVSVYEIAFHE